MNRPIEITLTPDEERRLLEIGRRQWAFFQCIAHISPAETVREWPTKIRGRVVERVRPARFMPFKDGMISDLVRPPSDGERVFLTDVVEEDLAPINRYWEDLHDFCRETGSVVNSWDAAVDVRLLDVETGESMLGYFDGAAPQHDGRYKVGVFLPDIPKAKARNRIVVRTPVADEPPSA